MSYDHDDSEDANMEMLVFVIVALVATVILGSLALLVWLA